MSLTGAFLGKRLSLGLSCAPEIYQHTLAKALAGLPGVQNYADDVIIAGRTQEEHDQRLHSFLGRVSELGLTLNESKCAFGLSSLK